MAVALDTRSRDILTMLLKSPTPMASSEIAQLLNIILNSIVELILSVSVFILLFSMSLKGSIIIIIGGIAYYYLTKTLSLKIQYMSGKRQLKSGQTETFTKDVLKKDVSF